MSNDTSSLETVFIEAIAIDSPKDRESDPDRSDPDRSHPDRTRTGIDRRTFLQQGGRAAIGLGALGVTGTGAANSV